MAYLGDPNNPVWSTFSGSSTATPISTNVTATVAATIAPANATRIRCFIWNETGTLYVQFGPSAADTNYAVRLTANTGYEVVGYTGVITAIKASGTTAVRVTDIG